MSAPFQPHSDTSRAAAESVEPRLNKQQRELLERMRTEAMGFTDDELFVYAVIGVLRISPNGVRARRIELVRKGLVYDSGRTRLTRSGRLATIWAPA